MSGQGGMRKMVAGATGRPGGLGLSRVGMIERIGS